MKKSDEDVQTVGQGGKVRAIQDSLRGIVIRQAMDPVGAVFQSPDLIVTGTTAAFDAASFIDPDAYRWYFSRAPVIGSPNYLYVRGVNYAPGGAQQARVYLYSVRSDQLLDPTKWLASGFTVNGVAQNYVGLSAISRHQLVTAASPMMWTPPAVSGGLTYYLISWIDNSAAPSAPVFPTQPFANLAALSAYVSGMPNLAILDTVYRGCFLRQFPGQTVNDDGNGNQQCPDIIVNGQLAALDASAFTTDSSYNSGQLSANAAIGLRNFVYVRAINTVAGAANARVYLYWTTSGAVSPLSWQTNFFTYAGQPQNWVDLTATAGSQVMVSTLPLVWLAPPPPTGQTYILIAYVDNSSSPHPPVFTAFGYPNADAVKSFVAGHSQLAWLAINSTTVPQPTMSWEAAVVSETGATKLVVGIQLNKIPIDGTLQISVPGPDAANTVVIPSMRVPDPNALVAWPVTYPTPFNTSVVMNYAAGPTPPGGGSIDLGVLPRGSV